MKILKFNSHLIAAIMDGTKSSTWRYNDDEDLSVGDELQFVNSDTGQTFGYADVIEVTSKRIRDINEHDFEGHNAYRNIDEIVSEFQQFYGSEVGPDSIIKVVKYHFAGESRTRKVDKNTTKITEVKLFTDGGSRGNPGPSATGLVITGMDNNVVKSAGKYLGITTNNQAEYQAVLQGLELAKTIGARKVHVYMDSLLVVNQMAGIFKIKNRELWPIHQAIRDLTANFESVNFVHVPREMNKLADAEVNRILDEQQRDGIRSELV